MLTTALTAAVFFFASAINGIAGFGLAQVTMGLMPLFRSSASATIIYTMVGAVSHTRVWWSVREHFDWKTWLLPVSGLAVGMPIGVTVFQSLDETQLRLTVGATIAFAVVLLTAVRMFPSFETWVKNSHFQPGWKSAVMAGFLAGILGGAVAIPGPPMILYATFMMASDMWDSKRMKATLTGFFATLILYRLVGVALTGALSGSFFGEIVWVVPAQLLGAAFGVAIFNRIPKRTFEICVLVLLGINAVLLIVSSWPQ